MVTFYEKYKKLDEIYFFYHKHVYCKMIRLTNFLVILCLWSLNMTAQIDTVSIGNRVDINLNISELSEVLETLQERIDQLEYEVDSLSWKCGDLFSYNGQDYPTVEIGSQCWFKENLNSDSFADGTLIGNGTTVDNNTWSLATAPLCAPFDNNQTYRTNYGLMYNGEAALSNVCPSDWLVPTESDFSKLFNYLGGADVAGGEMKATAMNSIPWNGEDSHGFTALPGGYRSGSSGQFGQLGDQVKFWTSTEASGELGVLRLTTGSASAADMTGDAIRTGAYIRCLKGSAVDEAVDEAIDEAIDEAVPTNLSELNNDLNFMNPVDIFLMTDGNAIATFLTQPSMAGWLLRNHDFHNADLFEAVLSGGDFNDSDFRYSYLEGADLSGANLRGCDFSGAWLQNANFSGADLEDAIFHGANLTGADLSGAYIRSCDNGLFPFNNANMSGVIATPGQFHDYWYGSPEILPPGYSLAGCDNPGLGGGGNICFICDGPVYISSKWVFED